MSYVGRVVVRASRAELEGETVEINRSRPGPVFTGARLTPLNMLTGSRVAVRGDDVVRRVGGATWWDRPTGPSLSESLRRQFSAVFARTPSGPPEIKSCPRCGGTPHTEWGPEYERLICQEITAP